MRTWFSWLQNNQRNVAIATGYLLVAGLFFSLGRFSDLGSPTPVRVEEPPIDMSQLYNNVKSGTVQLPAEQGAIAGEATGTSATPVNCAGKIKGNISSTSKIYHLPGGAFYNRTNPEMCFSTEAEAQAAGFRRSQR